MVLDRRRPPGTEAETAPVPGALTVPAFRYLWLNNALYAIVINAQRFTFGWLVLDGLGRDEFWQGLVTFALGIPLAALVLQAGAWADRYDRKMLLIVGQVGSLAVMGITTALVAADLISIGLVLALAVAFGAAQAIGQPVRAALVPALVSPEQLFNAIAVNAIAMTLAMIAGPVLLQVIGDLAGFEGAFGVQTLLLAVGLLALIPLRVPANEPASDAGSVWSQVREAIAHIRADRAVAKLFLLLIAASFSVNPAVMVTLQAFIQQDLGGDGGDVAPVLAVMGLGIAISSAIIMRKGDMARKGALFQRAMMLGSTVVFLMGRVPSYGYLIPLAFVMGLAGGFYINMNQGLIQANTPERLMGRVMAIFTLVQIGFLPIGALVLGSLATVIGLGATISVGGLVALGVVVYTYTTDAHLRTL
ncbi:MAG: MFS transporter [Acidimicrobiia bacterium]|nr:MFS transporter [Acidimicrobiia bacterium]